MALLDGCVKRFPSLSLISSAKENAVIPIVGMSKLRRGAIRWDSAGQLTRPRSEPAPQLARSPALQLARSTLRARGRLVTWTEPRPSGPPRPRRAPSLSPSLPLPPRPGPAHPPPLPTGSLRPCRVGLRAAGRRRPDGRAHARTSGRTRRGRRARTARAGAARPAREGRGRAQVRRRRRWPRKGWAC